MSTEVTMTFLPKATAVLSECPDGLTAKEAAERLGVSEYMGRRILSAGVYAGTFEAVARYWPGRRGGHPTVYRLAKNAAPVRDGLFRG